MSLTYKCFCAKWPPTSLAELIGAAEHAAPNISCEEVQDDAVHSERPSVDAPFGELATSAALTFRGPGVERGGNLHVELAIENNTPDASCRRDVSMLVDTLTNETGPSDLIAFLQRRLRATRYRITISYPRWGAPEVEYCVVDAMASSLAERADAVVWLPGTGIVDPSSAEVLVHTA